MYDAMNLNIDQSNVSNKHVVFVSLFTTPIISWYHTGQIRNSEVSCKDALNAPACSLLHSSETLAFFEDGPPSSIFSSAALLPPPLPLPLPFAAFFSCLCSAVRSSLP